MLLAALLQELPAAMLEADAADHVIRTGAEWVDVAIAESWFEDDQEVAQIIGRLRTRKRIEMVKYDLQNVLGRRLDRWADPFVWTALWLREAPASDVRTWRNFAILANALSKGHDLTDIAPMRDIAARTVMTLA